MVTSAAETSELLFTWRALGGSVLLSAGLLAAALRAIPALSPLLLAAGRKGRDLGKAERPEIPESLGVVVGTLFLIGMFLFIPVAFYPAFAEGGRSASFPHARFVEFLAALLSICCMVLLGYADDTLDLRWRHKLWLPTLASLPLLMVHLVNVNSTFIVVPRFLRFYIGDVVDIGILYFVYMGMLAVFCTNAINILAGINGLEVGQSSVIGASVLIFNCMELFGCCPSKHIFSIYFILPFLAVSIALFHHNRYPARVFVGDTYCYFAGMTFAVVAILGHFSKTMILFFIPQTLNFIYSVPQLFKLVPCPRHRLPRFDLELQKHVFSTFDVKASSRAARLLQFAHSLKLVSLARVQLEDVEHLRVNNLTLVNYLLLWSGPLREDELCRRMLLLQAFFSCVAFTIRYPLAWLFY